MSLNISLRCQCGAVRGKFSNLPKSSTVRIACLCDDCQAYAHYLGKAKEVLDENGGTDIVAVSPANIKFTQGFDQVKVLRLRENGMYRWYAGCCKTPIANTQPSVKFPFAGVVSTIMAHAEDGQTREQALGPLYGRMMGKSGIGKLPAGTAQTLSPKILFAVLRFLIPSWLKGLNRPSPFFDDVTGEPRVKAYVLTTAERDALRPLCGPKD